ncbi:MAG: hypothetical protein GF418_01785, partial [Chitinivibrionales bacterium]|nr:hypothetical protein [Chitinivibrionales bacterium]MBD3394330.1 hypothetical protein [Chitinivibrionales bacterium]
MGLTRDKNSHVLRACSRQYKRNGCNQQPRGISQHSRGRFQNGPPWTTLHLKNNASCVATYFRGRNVRSGSYILPAYALFSLVLIRSVLQVASFSILHIFSLACGLSIFLYGMQQGEKNLRSLGSSRIRRIVNAVTRHRLLAFAAGILVTILTQSSSATTVLLVGLASANLLTLNQSMGMILGSDLGTTLTVQLFAFKFHHIAPLLIAAGFLMTFQRRSKPARRYGNLVLAFGFVFFGMKLMSDSVEPIRHLPSVALVIENSLHNPLLGLLVATVFTAIVQSSAATLAILISLALTTGTSAEAPTLAAYFPLILGANLGTCATAFLSTLRAHTEGIRVAWAHFLFKAAGVLLFFPLAVPLQRLVETSAATMPVQIAMAHTAFNVAIAALFLPTVQFFGTFIERHVRYSGVLQKQFELRYLHSSALSIPVLALGQAVREIDRMSESVISMLENSRRLIHHFSPDLKDAVVSADDQVDFLHEHIVEFVTQLSQSELDEQESAHAYEVLMVTTDLEHIGDIVSKSIAAFAQKMDESRLPFPDDEKQHVLDFYSKSS